jgi:hypothetical protein
MVFFLINNNMNILEPLAQFEVIMLQNQYSYVPYVFLNSFYKNYDIIFNYFLFKNNINCYLNIFSDFINTYIYENIYLFKIKNGFLDFFDDYIIYDIQNFFYFNNNVKYSYILLFIVILFLFVPIVQNLILIPHN